ncbi:hypothetical protein ACLKA6_004544 [Drosophila palustris]
MEPNLHHFNKYVQCTSWPLMSVMIIQLAQRPQQEFYVNDFISGANLVAEARQKMDQTCAILARGQFKLRKCLEAYGACVYWTPEVRLSQVDSCAPSRELRL